MANPNICRGCQIPIIPRKGQWTGHVKIKEFCTARCASQFLGSRRKQRPINMRLCEAGCGKTVNSYKSRYCSQSCQHEKEDREYIEKWKAGIETGNTGTGLLNVKVRRFMLKKANYRCELCGWGEINPTTGKIPLNVDHKDGNYTNSAENNLRVLCPNCHSLTPTYGSLNRGHGRAMRRAKDLKYKYAKLA